MGRRARTAAESRGHAISPEREAAVLLAQYGHCAFGYDPATMDASELPDLLHLMRSQLVTVVAALDRYGLREKAREARQDLAEINLRLGDN